MYWTLPLIVILIVIALIYIFKSIKIVPESRVLIIEKLGKYDRSLSSGLSFLNPFFDRVARSVSLKEQVVDFPPQPVITKDNATMQIDTVVYFQITDPKLYTYGVERPLSAIENLTATTLRNIIGDMTVDQIKVNRVELKSILPPADIRVAMEKEMKAEREKRANILEAQAKREAAILVAEGEKQAAILRAEAKKEQQIKEAEGRAEAILSIQKAQAEALKLLNEAAPTKEVLSLKGMETFEKVADGKSTKIIIPSELQNLAGMVTAFSELAKKDKDVEQK